MAIAIDPTEKLFILDSVSTSGVELYRAWVNWVVESDNLKYLSAFRSVGGDDTIPGQRVSPYFFLINGWKIRPMEADQDLTVDGFIYSSDGFKPVIDTLGDWKVQVSYTVPMLAVAYDSSGVPAPTVDELISGMIAAGFTPSSGGGLTTEEHHRLMAEVATQEDILTLT